MVKFYIEDDLFEVYDVGEEEFKKELIQTKKIWSNDNECEIEIEKDEANGTITKTWCFEWEKLWVVANDYKELEELGL